MIPDILVVILIDLQRRYRLVEEAQKVLTRLGFNRRSTYREHVFTNGAYHDTDPYRLLAPK